MTIGGEMGFEPLPGGALARLRLSARASHISFSVDVRFVAWAAWTTEIRDEDIPF